MTRTRFHPLHAGFTLVELLVAIAVLAVIVLATAQILGTTASLTTANNKHMDANDQARMVFDRMADDFARMTKRKDVDYVFWKNAGNDAMYFYTEGASYFDTTTFNTMPAGATTESEKSGVSLVGYRVNNTAAVGVAPYYQLERLGKALSCDGGAYNSSPPANNSVQPNVMVFLAYPPAGNDVINGPSFTDLTGITYSNAYFNSTLAGAYSNNSSGNYGALPSAVGSYPGSGVASVFNDSTDTAYHTVGSQVFRFEYSFQLKDGTMSSIPVMTSNAGTNGLPFGLLTATQRPLPTDDSANTNGDGTFSIGSRWYDTTNQIGYICLDATPNDAIWHEIGIQDIAAIIVTIAVIDKQGLIYIQNSGINLKTVAAQLPDYVATTTSSTVKGDPAYLLDATNNKGWAYALLPTSAGGKSPLATATGMPQSMVSQIRLYQRYFYLNNF